MKTHLDADHRKIWPPHLTYNAFSLALRVKATGFLNLNAVVKNSYCFCPAKQKRALLKSNPPRDNWTEGDEIKNVSVFGEAQTSPSLNPETIISEPSYALKNLEWVACCVSHTIQQITKNTLSRCPFFRSKRTHRKRRAARHCTFRPQGSSPSPPLGERRPIDPATCLFVACN